MATLRQIAQLGNSVLRGRAAEITDFDDPLLANLVADLLATLQDSNGVGIAAPQIYEPYRIVIVASRPNPRYPHAPLMEPKIMINPQYTPRDNETAKDWEGCLSIPGIRALVPRFLHIDVDYCDLGGNPCSCSFDGFPARIFQHEYDHLDGYVFLDRVESNRDIIAEKEYFKRIAAN